MARITVEDCLKNVNNRFALIHLSAKRVRQLRKGEEPTIISKNKDVVVSLREIAAGTVIQTDGSEKISDIEELTEALSTEASSEKDEGTKSDDKG